MHQSLSELEVPTYKPSSEDLDLQQWVLLDAMIGTFDKFLSYLCSPAGGNHDKDTSIRDFYEFCFSDRVLEEPDIDEIVNMKMLLTHWMSS